MNLTIVFLVLVIPILNWVVLRVTEYLLEKQANLAQNPPPPSWIGTHLLAGKLGDELIHMATIFLWVGGLTGLLCLMTGPQYDRGLMVLTCLISGIMATVVEVRTKNQRHQEGASTIQNIAVIMLIMAGLEAGCAKIL